MAEMAIRETSQRSKRPSRCDASPSSRLESLLRPSDAGISNRALAPQIVDDVLNSPGQPLDAETRAFMEPRLGHGISRIHIDQAEPLQAKLTIGQPNSAYELEADRVADSVTRGTTSPSKASFDLSRVRIHRDSHAIESAQALGARAYTVRSHVVFGANQFAPDTLDGRHLLAHELAHVAQQNGSTQQLLLRKPDQKSKSKSESTTELTVATIDKLYGPLTAEIADKVLKAYGSPLAGKAKSMVDAFDAEGVSAWIGIAIMKEESSFGNRANNSSLDERNEANPFSVHFTSPGRWPDGCKKNALLIDDKAGKYDSSVNEKCSAKGVRLTTFDEAAKAAAKAVKKNGLESYREQGGYEDVLNGHLHSIVKKIGLKPK